MNKGGVTAPSPSAPAPQRVLACSTLSRARTLRGGGRPGRSEGGNRDATPKRTATSAEEEEWEPLAEVNGEIKRMKTNLSASRRPVFLLFTPTPVGGSPEPAIIGSP